ncbi:serine/threonine-protein kinase WNK1 [Clonorchis sinensis]|uniref:Serine/threonine-protein kinase WNK1 n=1 Tax=Clonorchis sinensis TaxID=79923 RepID=G7Y6H7_CLOSI|nr:serine/threonine-protein kinase WNK1 [Clonorchis sinensis]
MHHKIQPPILHRDLKADNCFLYGASDEEYLNVKVGDFGLATHVNNSGRKTMLGTLGFMAPEIFDEKYDEKVDIYAFGMLMLEVMTNRTPYDECETVMQVAAKTMSGQGPDIMDKVLNPSLREVISACIQPLTCFRPSAEELYFHPLFQPKTLPVEVEPNYDNATDRAEVLDRFVRSLDVAETRNPNFNLRLRFRDKKMLQELGLDDGESLEFDLDIYKAEDQDIPDLIHNLRLGYEDKLWRVFENPKQPDKKIVSSHLDKLFNSIRLQMQFLVKVLLGKRWKAILDSLVDEPRVPRKKDGQSTLDEDDDSDTDGRETSSFTIIGKYKGKWSRAKRLLDREIQAYRNATAGHPLTSNPANVGPKVAPVPASIPNMPTSLQSDAAVSGGTLTPNVHPPVHPSTTPIPTSNVQTSVPETVEPSSMHSNVATIGKFSISTPPSASGAPPAVSQGTIQAQTAQLPSETIQTPPVAEHVGLQPHPSNEANVYQTTAQGSVSTAVQNPNPESGLIPGRLHPDQNVTQPPVMQTPLSANPVAGHPSGNQIPPMTAPQPQASHLPNLLPTSTKTDSESVAAVDLDSVTRSALLLQQVLQGFSVPPLKPFSEGSAAQTGPNSPAYSSSVAQPSQFPNQLQQQPTMTAPQTQQSVLTDGATAPVAISPATAGTGSIPSHYISPEALIQSLTAGLLGSTTPEMQQLQQPIVQSSNQGLSSSVSAGQIATGAPAIPMTDQQALLAASMRGQPPVLGGSDVAPQSDLDAAVKVEPVRHDAGQPSVLLNQLTEALLGVATGTAGTPASAFGLQPTQQQALLQTLINQQSGQQQQLAQLGSATSNKFKGSGYTATNEEVERAAKEAVVQMLDSLRADVSSVKLNQDYVFYPRPHPSTTYPSFPPVALSDPSSIASSHLAAGLPVTAKSSQTSLNIPSLASRSVASQQLGTVPQPNAIVASSPNPQIPGASLLYDTSAATANLEEVPPIENASHFNGLIVQNPLDSTSYARSHPFLSTNFLTGLASSETGRDDDDELGEISRPLSPAEISVPQQLQPFASRQILAPNFDSSIPSTLSFGSAATSYFSASSCGSTGLVSVPSATQHATSFPGTASASFDPSEGIASRQPFLPFGASYLSELLSLAAKHIAQLTSSASGTQTSLEEVTPLIPMVSSPSSVAYMPPTEVLTDVVTTDPVEHVRRELPFDANAFLLSHLNRVSALGQSQVTTTAANTGPAVTEPPEQDSFVTLTCTIPVSLEAVMREIIHRLCSAPLRSYLLFPSRVTATEEAAQQTVVRLLEIPQNHVFLGVPTSDDQAAPFSLTTFKTSGESAFIVLEGTHGDGRMVSVPRIYRTPVNSAVVLTPNGTVHCLNQASSIIPSLSSELPQRSSPQYSPTADTSDITQPGHASTAAVQPRELPPNMNADTFTLDDVLNLLLALRNSSHQHQRSATTSPTTETYSGVNPVATIEGQHVPSTTSRRSSATGSVHVVPHANLGKSFVPTPQFSQLQQLSLGRQQRILPIPQHHQLSQTVSTSKPPYIEQAGIQSSQLSSGRVSSIPGTVQDVPVGASFGSQVTGLSKDGAVAASYLTQPFTQANAMSQQSSVTSQPRWTTHERVPATAPPSLHSQQPASSSTEITAAGLQQALQLLSALNVTGSPEQLSSVLVQLLRNPNLMHSVPAGQSAAPVAASLRNPVTSLGARPCFSGQATLQRISTVSPPVPVSGFSATSSITGSTLPTILGRLLASNVGPTERIVPTETANLVPSQVAPTAPLPTRLAPLTSSPATVMNASIVDTTGLSHLASSGLQGVATASPQASSQQSLSYSSGQQIRPSHLLTHADGGHSQQVSVSQQNVHQKVPDLANLLRLIQSQPDANAVKELLATLPIETQIHLLSALQPHTTRVTGLSGAPVQQPVQTHQPNLASSFAPQPAASNPTSCLPVGPSSINPPAVTTAASVQLPRDVTAVPSVGDALQSSGVHHPLPAAPTTVANKFTVVPVKSENDEPAPPMQPVAPTTSQPSAAGTQWNQAPPRPPRQRTGQTAPPPPPPATPNSQLEIDPTGFSNLVTPVGPPASVTSQIASTPGLVTVLPTTSGLGIPVKQIPQNYKVVIFAILHYLQFN